MHYNDCYTMIAARCRIFRLGYTKFICIFVDKINKMLYIFFEVMNMTTKQMVKTALAYAGMTQAELARRLKTTPSNLNQKLQRNTLTREDLE